MCGLQPASSCHRLRAASVIDLLRDEGMKRLPDRATEKTAEPFAGLQREKLQYGVRSPLTPRLIMKWLLLVYAVHTTEPMTQTEYTSAKACFEAQRSLKAAHKTAKPRLYAVCTRKRV